MKRLVILTLVLAFAVWGGMHWLARSGDGAAPAATPLSDDMVQLDEPLPGAVVTSPLTVRGRARGTWYFEASFPIILTDDKGTVLTAVPAQAQSEWMTTDWVPFEATLTFTTDAAAGTLTLKKDNPSDLPEHDDSRDIPVLFR